MQALSVKTYTFFCAFMDNYVCGVVDRNCSGKFPHLLALILQRSIYSKCAR